MSRIKLIWDFRGADALHFAKHHAIHLDEFLKRENFSDAQVGEAMLTEMHAIAFIIASKEHMITLRDALKPNRGEYYNEEQENKG